MRFAFLAGSACLLAACPARPSSDASVDIAVPDIGRDATSDCVPFATAVHIPSFHGDRARSGWNARETDLTRARLTAAGLVHLWDSPAFDAAVVEGQSIPAHMYASPIYVDNLAIGSGPFAGRVLSVVVAATTSGWVYAVNAFASSCGGPDIAPGTIVWRTQLVTPMIPLGIPRDPARGFDGGMPLGVLSTPVIDTAATPPRVYLTALDAQAGWRAFALDATTGAQLPGWPVDVNANTVGPVNRNAPALFAAADRTTERGALNLSPDGATLYFGFSSAAWIATGWMVAVDTRTPRVRAAFSSAASGPLDGRGGIWGSGGPAVDDAGNVYVTTGNGLQNMGPTAGYWGDSLLRWTPDLALAGTYSPFNYCMLDDHDIDLAASSPALIDLDPSTTSTPHLLVFGGKQGSAYLLDRDHLPGALDHRPPCVRAAASDGSLLAPEIQAQFASRGPLQVFQPYSPDNCALDFARMHTTPATFRDASGQTFVYLSGASKRAINDATSVAPGLVRLRVVATPGQPAYLAIDATQTQTRLWNPGSPIVTSDGGASPIVWVLDSNQPRTAHLIGAAVAHPILYAFDGTTLALLWQSRDNELSVGGRYSSPLVVHGTAFVGTDRIQAYGLPR